MVFLVVNHGQLWLIMGIYLYLPPGKRLQFAVEAIATSLIYPLMVDLSLFVNVYQMVVGLCKPSPNGRFMIELTLPESKDGNSVGKSSNKVGH